MKDSERDELFLRARRAASPTDGDRHRVRRALAKRLGVTAGAAVGTSAAKAAASMIPSATTAGAGLTALGATKVAAGLMAVALVVATALPARQSSTASKTTPVSSNAVVRNPVGSPPSDHTLVRPDVVVGMAAPSPAGPSPIEPAVPEVLANVAHETPPPTPLATASPAGSRTPLASPGIVSPEGRIAPNDTSASPGFQAVAPVPSSDVANLSEVSLMADVQSALRSGDTKRVLALVREHEQRFPSSAWVPEREGARVLALCADANPRDARALGERFVDTYPLSPLGGRVRATCGLTGPSAPR